MKKDFKIWLEERLRDKSYRKKYQYYFVLTLLIPIIVILIANAITQKTVKEQVIQSNEKTLTQFFQRMDERMEQMIDDTFLLAMNSEFAKFAQMSESETIVAYAERVSLLKYLSNCYENGNYSDVFVWFSGNDRLISGIKPMASSGNLNTYSNLYYANVPHMEESISSFSFADATVPVLWPVIDQDGNRQLGISLNRYRADSNLPNYTVTLIANNAFIDKCIGQGVLTQHENAMLFNSSGELLFSYQTEALMELPEQCQKAGVFEIQTDKGHVTLLVYESKCIDGFYVMSVSRDAFYDPLKKVRIVSFCGILLSIVVGLALVHRMSLNTYKPLETVLALLQNNTNQKFDSRKHSEFEYIEKLWHGQENLRNASKMQNQKMIENEKRKNLLMAVMEGREINESEIEFLEQQIASSKCFYGGILQLKNCEKIGWDLISFVISNVFTELLEENFTCDILPLSSIRYMFWLRSAKEVSEEILVEQIKKGSDFLQENCEVHSVFGMSDSCQELYGIQQMYQQAQQALEYSFILPDVPVIKYHDIKQRQMNTVFYENNDIFSQVYKCLQTKNIREENVQTFLCGLLRQFEINTDAAIESVDAFRYEMLKTVNRIWAGKEIESFKRQRYIEELMEAENLDEYSTKLTQILYETGANIQKNSHKKSLAEKIKRYVEEHFADTDLNVTQIGEVFGMQGAYLSQIIREEYGMLLPNLISHIRIEYAKRLLKTTNATVAEISKSAGFLSSAVFIKTFKKLEGITPGDYRETHTNKSLF